ncbi:MAG: 16S rRNA (adenine(1518)-N(6)/adenine(1519)-N(6))-dimethyltransferase RsmA [Casimicrobium sp.]
MSDFTPHRARKRFGQNFLVDQNIINGIIDAIDPIAGQHIVEIGPGQAALTRKLIHALGSNGSIDAIEIDRDLVARLTHEFPVEKLRVHQADAMEFDFSTLPSPLRVVGNLPYNISTPILFRLCEYEDRISDMTFMLQKEVVDRMAAAAGEDARGRLSVMLQYRFKIEKRFDVPPTAFKPVPAVDSSIVRLTPLGEHRLRPKDEMLFARIVNEAFSQRRKMLRKSLANWVTPEGWEAIGVAPTARAEELSCEAFVAIADWAGQRRDEAAR